MKKTTQAALVALLGPLACGSDSCIAEGTWILAPSGLLRIESLRAGDLVYAVDVSTGMLVETSITAIRSSKRECIALGLSGGRRLRCTPDHPLFDPEARVYAPASEWVEGRRARLLSVMPDDTPKALDLSETIVDAGVFEVFDLSVASEHHNYVADAVLVHNKRYTGSDAGATFTTQAIGTIGEPDDSDDDGTGETSGDAADSDSGMATGGTSETASSDSGSAGSTAAAGSSSETGSEPS
ncbi:MAG: Hint domain-containing protein [Myxococcota bacterium]